MIQLGKIIENAKKQANNKYNSIDLGEFETSANSIESNDILYENKMFPSLH